MDHEADLTEYQMTDPIIKIQRDRYCYYTLTSDHQAGRVVYHNDKDQPAIIRANGDQQWYQDGHLHREGDQPAIILANGNQYWYQHDQLHRGGDQPAIILANGDQYWYQHDQLHREGDQPAVIYANGQKEYWLKGKHILSAQELDQQQRLAHAMKYL